MCMISSRRFEEVRRAEITDDRDISNTNVEPTQLLLLQLSSNAIPAQVLTNPG
jgi:hypothetical protein